MKSGLFDHETLTVKFGGKLSIPKNIFTATAVKVPKYTYKVYERECLGGGWYGAKQWVEKTEDNCYLIFRDDECIGMMFPYASIHNIKSELIPELNQQAKEYLKELINPNPVDNGKEDNTNL